MDPVTHFEMPYEDAKRLSAFYKSAFGWKMKDTGEQMGHYILASTTETGPEGGSKTPGAINGGFFPKKPEWPAQYPSVVIEVGNIKKAIQKIAKAGGKVLGEPMEIPGVGWYVSFLDSEGNRASMMQPVLAARPAKRKPAAGKKAVAKKKAAVKKKK